MQVLPPEWIGEWEDDMWRALVILLVLMIPVSLIPVAAQQVDIGIISRIKDHKKDVSSTQRAQLWRVGEGGPVRRELPLRNEDIIRLGQNIFLDLGLFGEDIESRAVLGTRSLSAEGAYTIRQDGIDELGGIELVVRQGVLVVEHVRGRLTTVAAGVRTRIFGTVVMISADADGTEAHFYLPEGRIGFLDWEDLSMLEAGEAGRAWRLREGERPEEVIITAQMRQRWSDEVKYNTEDVWGRTRAFWQRPEFYVPAAVVVVGAAVLILTSRGSDDARGYVIASFPRPQ
jgi:hypothetical protein